MPEEADSHGRLSGRVKASLSGTNLELMGDYNQRLIYQAVRTQGPLTRNDLMDLSGLTKPTVANIVRRLLEYGLLVEVERIYGGRGQPAAPLMVAPDGCFSVGVSLADDRIDMVLMDAVGGIRAHTRVRQASAGAEPVRALLAEGLRRLLEGVEADRLIGIGVALSGKAQLPPGPFPPVAGDVVPPVFTDSDAVACAIGESLFGAGQKTPSFYYVLIGEDPVGSLVIDRDVYRGAHPDRHNRLFADEDRTWCRQAVTAEAECPDSDPPAGWLETAAGQLLQPLISVTCLLNPDMIFIGGRVPPGWLEQLVRRCNALLAERANALPVMAPIHAAGLSANAAALGAASLPMRARLFPSGDALLKPVEGTR